MSVMTPVTRPELTLPDSEAARLRAAYEAAEVVLEYGSGGSTVMAGEMPNTKVFSVESDPDWAAMMREWFAQNPPAQGSEVDVIWADLGETKDWGYPKNRSGYMRYARYPLAVWENMMSFASPMWCWWMGGFARAVPWPRPCARKSP
ncbi:hypothetical protein ACM25N_03725 [Roseovarius sp. C7]|uniref:hypothetical protein n=1 Tax=Roseovarius sp. C7 TaxID=3398643 RepID=UPI0039F4699E